MRYTVYIREHHAGDWSRWYPIGTVSSRKRANKLAGLLALPESIVTRIARTTTAPDPAPDPSPAPGQAPAPGRCLPQTPAHSAAPS